MRDSFIGASKPVQAELLSKHGKESKSRGITTDGKKLWCTLCEKQIRKGQQMYKYANSREQVAHSSCAIAWSSKPATKLKIVTEVAPAAEAFHSVQPSINIASEPETKLAPKLVTNRTIPPSSGDFDFSIPTNIEKEMSDIKDHLSSLDQQIADLESSRQALQNRLFVLNRYREVAIKYSGSPRSNPEPPEELQFAAADNPNRHD